MVRTNGTALFLLVVFCASVCIADTDVPSEPSAPAEELTNAVPKKHGWGHRILWYIPNRILDLVDIVRLRARVGPGISVNVRLTEEANLYMGEYHTAYAGLPGPRRRVQMRSPVGFEQEKGLMLMGVDATDDMNHEPGYSSSEFDIGAQLLIVGGEIGIDPVEIGDFLAGFLFIDPVGDDR